MNDKLGDMEIENEISVPMVIIFQENLKEKKYHGFVPGIKFDDIVSKSLEECKKELKVVTIKKIKDMAENNTKFPYFPKKEEILQDFENVCFISFIKVKSSK